jgi:GT2 family glycosyltransferase
MSKLSELFKEPPPPPAVDVVIPTRGRGALVADTIATIRASSLEHFTLWVVDQSTDDATERAVQPHAHEDRRVRYVRSITTGASAARNVGAALGNAPLIAFTDDDCRVTSTWLAQLVQVLSEDGNWAVFGRVLPGEELGWSATDALNSAAHHDEAPVSPALRLAIKTTTHRQVFEGSRWNLGFGHGANWAMRRDRFMELNGFDELMGAGGALRSWDERDLGYRILARGGRIVYTPDPLVYHCHWRGWSGVRRTYMNYAFGTGAAVAKYIRCGDPAALYLLAEWCIDQGVRQVLSGLFKWRSRQKIEVGLLQIVYPFVGFLAGSRASVDAKRILYARPAPAGLGDTTWPHPA